MTNQKISNANQYKGNDELDKKMRESDKNSGGESLDKKLGPDQEKSR